MPACLPSIKNVSDPVYPPNSKGGPRADSEHFKPPSWYVDGEIMRSAYVSHAEDDDWGQAGTLVREVLDDAARDRLVSNVTGHLLNGVTEPVLERARQGGVLARLHAVPAIGEVVVLSTCNRVEVYAAADGPADRVTRAVAGVLATHGGSPSTMCSRRPASASVCGRTAGRNGSVARLRT